ncbi:MAG TPA: hypothetical protein PLW66_09195, partial [Saprospiraceae bacterium]|nr:hypothetical protein [Saprospiraceae bacterium]
MNRYHTPCKSFVVAASLLLSLGAVAQKPASSTKPAPKPAAGQAPATKPAATPPAATQSPASKPQTTTNPAPGATALPSNISDTAIA